MEIVVRITVVAVNFHQVSMVVEARHGHVLGVAQQIEDLAALGEDVWRELLHHQVRVEDPR